MQQDDLKKRLQELDLEDKSLKEFIEEKNNQILALKKILKKINKQN